MLIPEHHKEIIQAMVAADPEVAQATCDIPHEDPSTYLIEGDAYGSVLPYCGCFVGVYAWMQECKKGNFVPPYFGIPEVVSEHVGCSASDISHFAGWCHTPERDEEAVRYARGLLATPNG